MLLAASSFVATGLLLVSLTAALAGASQAPIDYRPDPRLRTASRAELEGGIRRICTITQARLQNTRANALTRPCGCYASLVMRSLDRAELDFYRNTGYFSDSARAKALAAIDACNLQRPI